MMMAGAKRPRVSADKQTKLLDLQDSFEGCVQRISQDQHPALQGAIARCGAMPPTFAQVVAAMDNPTAKVVSTVISTGTTEQRIAHLAKLMYSQQYNDLVVVEQRLKHTREMLRLSAEANIMRGYGNEDGTICWEKMRDDVLARI